MSDFDRVLTKLEQSMDNSEPVMTAGEMIKIIDNRLEKHKEKLDGYRQVKEKPKGINIVDISPAAVKKLRAMLGGTSDEEESPEIDYSKMLKELQNSIKPDKTLIQKLTSKLLEFAKSILGQVFVMIGNVVRWTFKTIGGAITGLSKFVMKQIERAVLMGAAKGATGMFRTTKPGLSSLMPALLRGTAGALTVYGATEMFDSVKDVESHFGNIDGEINKMFPESMTPEGAYEAFVTSDVASSISNDFSIGDPSSGDDQTLESDNTGSTLPESTDTPPDDTQDSLDGVTNTSTDTTFDVTNTSGGDLKINPIFATETGPSGKEHSISGLSVLKKDGSSRPVKKGEIEDKEFKQKLQNSFRKFLDKDKTLTPEAKDNISNVAMSNEQTNNLYNFSQSNEIARTSNDMTREQIIHQVMQSNPGLTEDQVVTMLQAAMDGSIDPGETLYQTESGEDVTTQEYFGSIDKVTRDEHGNIIKGDPDSIYEKNLQNMKIPEMADVTIDDLDTNLGPIDKDIKMPTEPIPEIPLSTPEPLQPSNQLPTPLPPTSSIDALRLDDDKSIVPPTKPMVAIAKPTPKTQPPPIVLEVADIQKTVDSISKNNQITNELIQSATIAMQNQKSPPQLDMELPGGIGGVKKFREGVRTRSS